MINARIQANERTLGRQRWPMIPAAATAMFYGNNDATPRERKALKVAQPGPRINCRSRATMRPPFPGHNRKFSGLFAGKWHSCCSVIALPAAEGKEKNGLNWTREDANKR